jgi:class 3 adenylate cyclase
MVDWIVEVNETHNLQEDEKLDMRIGIHIGEVIAGITGTNIVRYDIYGPDVLLANKMESGGEAGRVNVSDRVREVMEARAPGQYEYTFNKNIEAKAVDKAHDSFLVTDLARQPIT